MAMNGKVVLITGASRGIGEAAARSFAAAGAKLALVARDADRLGALVGELGQESLAIPCDVTRSWEVEAAVEMTRATFGRLDVLINNAGAIEPIGAMEDILPEDWGKTIDINLKGVFHGMRAALPAMLQQGGGTVLTVSSGAAHRPMEGWSAYCASKAGAAMLTRSLDLEYRARGIRAIGLSPGTVATQMQRDIKASGVNAISKLDWSEHIPADWPGRALVWLAGQAGDRFLGEEVRLREEAIRREIGLI
ncbi:SDR family oxidoreductase [Pseudoroseicyclus aestuarii]|uniref:NADP-dependent 3-hydroxy acid dehydrogenase YdfG n=1 Tax=Pseudoroseicyclus aestuarii TaxID=1795041 RepID=A0A318SR32_9RHOB|nr:SDR family oxidoreductase [Pseudoroseicyclus aestuarii]PYE84270.1 NADP-dependent 3-hydroxy acid dehydrogenase YdfG [Pseudoroseicyclus aestuarii]